MSQLLHYSKVGQGEPLLILHGLFGSSKNWQSLAKQFGERFTVFTVDLRNHGSSFHDPLMNYDVMANDVNSLLEHLGIERCLLIGHSMGGKVGITLADRYPERLSKLVAADIAPVAYQHGHNHNQLLAPILAINLDEISTRSEVDQLLSSDIPDPMLRGFLLQNLVRDDASWRWKVNWSAIQQQMHELVGFPFDSEDWQIDTPTLFIRGENSDYIDSDGLAVIDQHFSQARVETIAKAGHWLHAEQPKQFLQVVLDFVSPLDDS